MIDVIGWIGDFSNAQAKTKIVAFFKGLVGDVPIESKKNSTSMKDRSSFKNAKVIDE
jgi:hypothetical protein